MTSGFQFGELAARAGMLAPVPIARLKVGRAPTQDREPDAALLIDSTLEDSFPASDPPSWTAAVARPAAPRGLEVRTRQAGAGRRLLQRAAALF